MNDGIVGYGPFATNQIAYTFTGSNGFSAAIALEEGDEAKARIIDTYMPHVVGGVSYTQGWGKVGVVAAYDANLEDVAVKGRLDVNATEQLSLFVMAGYIRTAPMAASTTACSATTRTQPGLATGLSGAAQRSRSTTRRPSTPKSTMTTARTSRLQPERCLPAGSRPHDHPGSRLRDNFGADNADAFGARIRFQRNF